VLQAPRPSPAATPLGKGRKGRAGEGGNGKGEGRKGRGRTPSKIFTNPPLVMH